jgi:hypothetical protein
LARAPHSAAFPAHQGPGQLRSVCIASFSPRHSQKADVPRVSLSPAQANTTAAGIAVPYRQEQEHGNHSPLETID